ncbi:uncharacterized protein LOC100891176 isoform X2 [Strongylocentrotus purpuratus]|uniref:Uncharacterized protein n=1 Tax=Strongylocentrotus purpuratus TaxID=7668 RepID=A0A7M7LT66_STRPU|nr:uncharacterized protein LOC100891176 isoform X2 [Strongylocentrotus purpuratus]|eukprot:XP_011671235.1 PREDICTED: alkaline serine protease ver112 [Strongylocentrotus purpuratus]
MLIFAILTASLASGLAVNATFHKVAEPIDDHYIIVMKSGYDVVPIKNLILGDRSGIFSGATVKHTYTKAIKGFSAKLSKRAVEKLLARDEIKYICQDGVVRVSTVAQWGLDRISQRPLPLDGDYNFTGNGSGVNVYVIDTGIYEDSMYFGGRAKVAYDSTDSNSSYGIDCDGHGTHCAGTIGAEIFGVAPGVNLFGVRVLIGCKKNGTTADLIAGCDYVAKSSKKPAVASMSLEHGTHRAVDEAVRGIIDAGITTVVAAGNNNTDACLFSPAGVKEVL